MRHNTLKSKGSQLSVEQFPVFVVNFQLRTLTQTTADRQLHQGIRIHVQQPAHCHQTALDLMIVLDLRGDRNIANPLAGK